MTQTEAVSLGKCLADASRLELIRALNDGSKYVELLSELLGRSPSTISFHLKKLEEAGLVEAVKEQYYTVYSLKPQALEARLMDVICPPGAPMDAQAQREQLYREKVLENLFEYGKLKVIPVQRKKRRIVLEKLAESFEKGRVYSEREVNLLLAQYHDDFCTLRREMVAERIMNRNKEGYWLL